MTNPGPEFKAPDSYPGLSPFRLAYLVCSPTPSNLHISTCGKKEEKAKTGREWGGSRDFVVRVLSSGPTSCISHWPGLAFFSISTTGCESLLDHRQEKCCEKQKPLQMRGGRTVTFLSGLLTDWAMSPGFQTEVSPTVRLEDPAQLLSLQDPAPAWGWEIGDRRLRDREISDVGQGLTLDCVPWGGQGTVWSRRRQLLAARVSRWGRAGKGLPHS